MECKEHLHPVLTLLQGRCLVMGYQDTEFRRCSTAQKYRMQAKLIGKLRRLLLMSQVRQLLDAQYCLRCIACGFFNLWDYALTVLHVKT